MIPILRLQFNAWVCVFPCSIGYCTKNTHWAGEETFEQCWRAVLGYKGGLFFLILTVASFYLHQYCKNVEILELIENDQHWGRSCHHISSYPFKKINVFCCSIQYFRCDMLNVLEMSNWWLYIGHVLESLVQLDGSPEHVDTFPL